MVIIIIKPPYMLLSPYMLLPYLQGERAHKQEYISKLYLDFKGSFHLNSPMKYVMPETNLLGSISIDWSDRSVWSN
jgi:hypothetical protein